MGQDVIGSGTTPVRSDTRRLLLIKLVNAAGSGGGGGGGVTTGNYAGGQPSFTPSTSGAVAIDTSNGRIWWWYSSQWN